VPREHLPRLSLHGRPLRGPGRAHTRSRAANRGGREPSLVSVVARLLRLLLGSGAVVGQRARREVQHRYVRRCCATHLSLAGIAPGELPRKERRVAHCLFDTMQEHNEHRQLSFAAIRACLDKTSISNTTKGERDETQTALTIRYRCR
jgi:hypothetical protein